MLYQGPGSQSIFPASLVRSGLPAGPGSCCFCPWSVHRPGISPRSNASCVLLTNCMKFRCPRRCHSVSQVGIEGGVVAPSCLGARHSRPPPAPRGGWAMAAISAPCRPRAMAATSAPCRPSRATFLGLAPPYNACHRPRQDLVGIGPPGRRRLVVAAGFEETPPGDAGIGSSACGRPWLPRPSFRAVPVAFGHRTATIVPVLRLSYCFPAVFPLPSDPIIALCTVDKGSGARAQMIHVFCTG
jgi:hypothetical protein